MAHHGWLNMRTRNFQVQQLSNRQEVPMRSCRLADPSALDFFRSSWTSTEARRARDQHTGHLGITTHTSTRHCYEVRVARSGRFGRWASVLSHRMRPVARGRPREYKLPPLISRTCLVRPSERGEIFPCSADRGFRRRPSRHDPRRGADHHPRLQ